MERTPYWLINHGFMIDALALPALAIFFYGLYRHWRRVRQGEKRLRVSFEDIGALMQRIQWKSLSVRGVLGSRVYRHRSTGLFHGLIYWGMLLLVIGTTLVFLNVLFGLPVMSGPFYLWFMEFTLDAAGLMILIGIGFLLARRLTGYARLHTPKARTGFIQAELMILAVVLTGFIVEGQRIHLSGAHGHAFVGYLTAQLLGLIGAGEGFYTAMWWFHGVLALGLIAWIPYSPLSHLLFIPVNAALAEPVMGADETAMDLTALESEADSDLPTMGTATIADFSARRRFDFSTCLWCGRCQEVCPAALTEKSLTPKGIVATLAEALSQPTPSHRNMVDAIGMQTLFECRTCGACAEACPALINPLKAIWGMRQNLMMERGEMPAHMLSAYRNMEALMQPFSSKASPAQWRQGLTVPTFTAGETEYLLWIGCAVTYEDRAQQIGRAMVKILNAAGVSYGIIEEARCTGDPAKQMGDDYLFAMLANTNIQLFADYGVRKVITLCPHCYNSFKQYYPPLGATYDVIPHPVLIEDLIRTRKLKTSPGMLKKIAYHDPCYLGRHNLIFDAPRQVLDTMGAVSELPRNRSQSFCCGAGGGNYWNEEEGQRINYARAQEAFENGADTVASACPFCLLMLTDGMKMYTERQTVFDIAELVVQHIETQSYVAEPIEVKEVSL